MITCSQLKIWPWIRLYPATYENHVQSELCTERWRTAWPFQIFLIATHLLLFIHDVLYAHIRLHKKILCCTKNCCVNKTIVSHRSWCCAIKLCGSQKNMLWRKKELWHLKEDSCWLNMFSVAQKRNTCLQKMVPVAYKYMLNWLKKFCVARKILWCRTKIKDGVHKCY